MNCDYLKKVVNAILSNALDIEVDLEPFTISMINGNFCLNHTLNLMEVASIFSDDDRFTVSFDTDTYSAVRVKFNPAADMKRVTASIFSSGKVIISGGQTLKEIAFAYRQLNEFIFSNIAMLDKITETYDKLDIIFSYNIHDFIKFLKKKNYSSWAYTRTNKQINF